MKTKSFKSLGKILLILPVFVMILSPALVLAQPPVVDPGGTLIDDPFGWVGTFLYQFAQWLTWIFFILAVIFLIIAAIMYLTAVGDQEKIGKAKSMLIYAIIALVIGILAWSLEGILRSVIGPTP